MQSRYNLGQRSKETYSAIYDLSDIQKKNKE
jgi:hypothetical protein